MLRLRPIDYNDLPAIADQPYSVTITTPGDSLEVLARLHESTGFWQEDSGALAIDDNGLKGTIQFFRSGPCIHGYELGNVIHDPNNWGKGYATAALRFLSDKLFVERPEVVRHQLTIACDNAASVKVAERCDFEREGILRASGFGSEPGDAFIYSRLKSTLREIDR